MTRVIGKRAADAIKAGSPLALLAEIDHPDGLVRYWTGLGILEYNGDEFTGIGKLGNITPVNYSSDISIQELSFIVTGVPPDVGTWISAEIRNRSALAWLAALDGSGRVIADPLRIVDAVLDYQTLQVDDNGTGTLTLKGRSGFYTLERALDEVYSSEDQRRRYPNDSGCDMISDLQQQDVIWTPT